MNSKYGIWSGAGTTETYNVCYNNIDDIVNVSETPIALDATSVSADPSLDNNYKPQGDSPCIGAGIQPLSLTDYNGDIRKSNAGFDIGAIWFDGPNDTTEEIVLASGGTK